MVGGKDRPVLKLKDMEEKHLHNLFLKNMSGLIEEVKNPTPRLNPNSKCGGMATHAGLAIELGITRKKSLSPQMEAILIWCQCRTREYDNVNICDFTQSWSNGLAFCALIHNFFPNAFDYNALKVDSPRDRLKNYEVAFVTGEKFAGVPDFLTAEDLAYCRILSQRKKWFLGSKVYNLFGSSDLTSMSSERRISTTIWRYKIE